MKVTYKINFACSDNLNSKDNIDYEFSVESNYVPTRGLLLAGKYVVIRESNYDVALDEAVVFGTCYYPRDKATNEYGEIDVKKAQNEAYKLISVLSEKYGLKGTYITRS